MRRTKRGAAEADLHNSLGMLRGRGSARERLETGCDGENREEPK